MKNKESKLIVAMFVLWGAFAVYAVWTDEPVKLSIIEWCRDHGKK